MTWLSSPGEWEHRDTLWRKSLLFPCDLRELCEDQSLGPSPCSLHCLEGESQGCWEMDDPRGESAKQLNKALQNILQGKCTSVVLTSVIFCICRCVVVQASCVSFIIWCVCVDSIVHMCAWGKVWKGQCRITSIRKSCFVFHFIWKLIISWKLEFINLQHVPCEEACEVHLNEHPHPTQLHCRHAVQTYTGIESRRHTSWKEIMHSWLSILCCLTIPRVAHSADPSYLDRCVNTICMVGNPYRLYEIRPHLCAAPHLLSQGALRGRTIPAN